MSPSVLADEDVPDWSSASPPSLIAAIGILLGGAVVFASAVARFTPDVGGAAWAFLAAGHQVVSLLYVIVACAGLFLAWQLSTDTVRRLSDLQLLATVAATLSLLDIVYGNWLYSYYTGPVAAAHLLPQAQLPSFRFKYSAALFTLPLTVTTAFIVLRYGRSASNQGKTPGGGGNPIRSVVRVRCPCRTLCGSTEART
jgi:hypothetical protein